MLQKIKKISYLLSQFFYLAIVFFTPIYFSVFLQGANVFELNKLVIFKIFTLLLLFCSIVNLIIYFDAKKFFNFKNFVLTYGRYLIIPSFFVVALIMATIFSTDIKTSLYGLCDRREGLESHLFYFLFFILTLFNIKTEGQLKKILATVAASSSVVCFYGMVQILGYDFFAWNEPVSLMRRIISTFGQPNFLSGYLLLVIPISFYWIMESRHWFFKIINSILLFVQILCLFFTYSMSGWIGFFLMLGIVLCIAIFNKNEKIKFYIKNLLTNKIVLISVFIFLVAFLGFVFYNKQAYYLVRDKVNNLFTQSGSVAVRKDFWSIGVDAFKKRPLLGYGLEAQEDVYNSYYKKDWAIYGNVNAKNNRAHNLILDLLLTGGVVLLFAYALLCVSFFKLIADNIRKKRFTLLNYLLSLSVAGYLTALMFNFSFVVGNIYFWMFFALVIKINIGFLENNPVFEEEKGGDLNIFLSLILIFLSGFFIVNQANRQIKVMTADYYYREIETMRSDGKMFFATLDLFKYIKNLDIQDSCYSRPFAVILIDWINTLRPYGTMYEKVGNSSLEEIVGTIDSNNYENIFAKSRIYTSLASEENQSYYNLAQNGFEEAIKRSPEKPQTYYELAQMFFKKKDFDSAIKNYEKALFYIPNENDVRLNLFHRQDIKNNIKYIDIGLADAYAKKGDYERAENYYNLALEANNYNQELNLSLAEVNKKLGNMEQAKSYEDTAPGALRENFFIYRKMAEMYYAKNDLDKAILYNKKGMKLEPNDYLFPLEIARIYKQKGDEEKALEFAREALVIEPSMKKIQDFIDSIE